MVLRKETRPGPGEGNWKLGWPGLGVTRKWEGGFERRDQCPSIGWWSGAPGESQPGRDFLGWQTGFNNIMWSRSFLSYFLSCSANLSHHSQKLSYLRGPGDDNVNGMKWTSKTCVTWKCRDGMSQTFSKDLMQELGEVINNQHNNISISHPHPKPIVLDSLEIHWPFYS